jgi:hypothetical protein
LAFWEFLDYPLYLWRGVNQPPRDHDSLLSLKKWKKIMRQIININFKLYLEELATLFVTGGIAFFGSRTFSDSRYNET